MTLLTAGLEENVIGDQTTIFCGGALRVGNRVFNCWNHRGHGALGWRRGLQHSCDVFFYTLGMRLGAERMEIYARKLGLGEKTGIDLEEERRGIVPGPKYLNDFFGVNGWTKGTEANIAIGQGNVLVTPLQLAVYTSSVATGKLSRPRIANRLVNRITGEVKYIPVESTDVEVSEETLEGVRDAMRMVVNEPGGTGYAQHRSNVIMCGKTGTAENPHGKDHAVFVGYAPYDDPRIAVAVVIEHGLHGASTAAPVACKLMASYCLGLYNGPVEKENAAALIPSSAELDSTARRIRISPPAEEETTPSEVPIGD